MKTGYFQYRICKLGIFSTSVFVTFGAFWIAPAVAASRCPVDISKATQEARKALEARNPETDRDALACLVEAVASLDAELKSLRAGTAAFTGPVYSPMGFVITKSEKKAP